MSTTSKFLGIDDKKNANKSLNDAINQQQSWANYVKSTGGQALNKYLQPSQDIYTDNPDDKNSPYSSALNELSSGAYRSEIDNDTNSAISAMGHYSAPGAISSSLNSGRVAQLIARAAGNKAGIASKLRVQGGMERYNNWMKQQQDYNDRVARSATFTGNTVNQANGDLLSARENQVRSADQAYASNLGFLTNLGVGLATGGLGSGNLLEAGRKLFRGGQNRLNTNTNSQVGLPPFEMNGQDWNNMDGAGVVYNKILGG